MLNVSCTLNSYILSWYSLRVKFPLKMKDIGIVEVIGQNSYCSRSGENIIDLWATKRKREDSYWSKITRAFLRNEKTKISQLNEKCSSIPWRLRMPIWKIIFRSKVLRLSELPTFRERPQTSICCLEWLGRLNWLATGLDASWSFLSTSRRCSRHWSPNRLPVSPMCNFLQ